MCRIEILAYRFNAILCRHQANSQTNRQPYQNLMRAKLLQRFQKETKNTLDVGKGRGIHVQFFFLQSLYTGMTANAAFVDI